MTNNTLQHYGIPGMRWGSQKPKSGLSNNQSMYKRTVNKLVNSKIGSKYKLSNDPAKELLEVEGNAPKSKSKSNDPYKTMSDNELRTRLNRLQMEKQYSQLSKKEKSFGSKFVTNVLVGAAQQTASKYVSQYMSKGVDSLIKTAIKK